MELREQALHLCVLPGALRPQSPEHCQVRLDLSPARAAGAAGGPALARGPGTRGLLARRPGALAPLT